MRYGSVLSVRLIAIAFVMAVASTAAAQISVSVPNFTRAEGTAFSGTVATFMDPDCTPSSATINWGDGTTTAGTIAGGCPGSVSGTHTYADEGSYTVTVTVTDLIGIPPSGTGTGTATITDADVLTSGAGVAISQVEGTPFSGTVANFTDSYTGNVASDFTATINWGDGTTTSGTVSGAGGSFQVSGTHTYSLAGTYSVMTTLKDDAPGTATATATNTATIGDALITGTGVIVSVPEGTAFNGNVATFTDANPLATAGDFTATINWGDGTTSAGVIVGGVGAFAVTGNHTYADEGSFIVVVAILDVGGSSSTVISSANVSEADVLTAGTPVTIHPTEGTSFNGTVANFTDTYTGNVASDFTATINWGDGTTTAGTVSGSGGAFSVSGSHTYAEEGPYTLSITMSDDAPGTATATAAGSAVVADADVLSPGAVVTINTTEGAAFNGTVANFIDSYAGTPAGSLVATINWGDGTTTPGTISGAAGAFSVSGNHIWADEGTFSVVVTLSEVAPGTATGTVTTAAHVGEADVLTAGAPVAIAATEGTAFNGTVANFTDAYTGSAVSNFTATINWGDGTTTPGTVTGSGASFSVSGTHTWANEGAFSVSVTLTDVAPGTATATATNTATVADADVLTAGAPLTIHPTEGSSFTVIVANFTDSYTGTSVGDLSATINWGDGNTSPGFVSGLTGAFAVAGTHTYAEEGSFTLAVTLRDIAPGTATATASGTATVADAPLTATAVPVTATAGLAFTGTTATFTDANPAAPLSDFTATINWGDGTTNSATVSVSGSGLAVSGTHTYATNGMYTVTTTIHDIGGSSATATGTATVGASPDLAITKTATGGPLFGAGLNVTYSIVATNTAGGTATGVTVTDTIPAGSTFVSATSTQGTCSGTTTVTCAIGTLATGASATITLAVKTPATPGPVANTATISAVEPDPNTANNSSTATITTVNPAAIPALSPMALLFLACALGGIVLLRGRM